MASELKSCTLLSSSTIIHQLFLQFCGWGSPLYWACAWSNFLAMASPLPRDSFIFVPEIILWRLAPMIYTQGNDYSTVFFTRFSALLALTSPANCWTNGTTVEYWVRPDTMSECPHYIPQHQCVTIWWLTLRTQASMVVWVSMYSS